MRQVRKQFVCKVEIKKGGGGGGKGGEQIQIRKEGKKGMRVRGELKWY